MSLCWKRPCVSKRPQRPVTSKGLLAWVIGFVQQSRTMSCYTRGTLQTSPARMINSADVGNDGLGMHFKTFTGTGICLVCAKVHQHTHTHTQTLPVISSESPLLLLCLFLFKLIIIISSATCQEEKGNLRYVFYIVGHLKRSWMWAYARLGKSSDDACSSHNVVDFFCQLRKACMKRVWLVCLVFCFVLFFCNSCEGLCFPHSFTICNQAPR